jgi:hypothetical protein
MTDGNFKTAFPRAAALLRQLREIPPVISTSPAKAASLRALTTHPPNMLPESALFQPFPAATIKLTPLLSVEFCIKLGYIVAQLEINP